MIREFPVPQDDEELIALETKVFTAMVRLACQLSLELPAYEAPERDWPHANDLERYLHLQDVRGFHIVLNNDYGKLQRAAVFALAYLKLEKDPPKGVQREFVLFRFIEEYESFLWRCISFKEKSFQLWNAWYGSYLELEQVTTVNIQALFEKHGEEDRFYRRLKSAWNKKPFGKVIGQRNFTSHHLGFDPIGIGTPLCTIERTENSIRFGLGASKGMLDTTPVPDFVHAALRVVAAGWKEVNDTLVRGDRPAIRTKEV